MKKLALITLTALVCLCLAGCAEDTVTPNEPTEAVTPNEVIEQPVVTPNEPETPAEPETPIEPEDNVVMLPEADENTKYITIEFPEDFPEEPYVEPNLVSPEEFEWGEYVPFIELDEWMFRQHMYEYDFGIITKDCKNLEDSKAVYQRLNDKYLIKSEVIDGIYCLENVYSVTDAERYGERFTDFLYKSKIIYISEEADKLGRLRYICEEPNSNEYLVNRNWTKIYEIFENGVLIDSIKRNSSPQSAAGGYINTATHNFQHPEIELNIDHQKYDLEFIDEKTYITKEWCADTSSYLLHVHSLQTPEAIYTIKVPNELHKGFKIEQFINDRYILFTVYKGFYGEEINFYFNTYLYDFETNELSCLEKYALNPCISPDLKYLCYTSDTSEAYGFGMENLMPHGFYLKNLESGETVFYEHPKSGLFGVMSWINEEKLMELIHH